MVSCIKGSSDLYLMKSDDKILSYTSPQEKLFIFESLLKHLNKEIKMLLYSARKDGVDAQTFHQKCDNVPN